MPTRPPTKDFAARGPFEGRLSLALYIHGRARATRCHYSLAPAKHRCPERAGGRHGGTRRRALIAEGNGTRTHTCVAGPGSPARRGAGQRENGNFWRAQGG